MGFAAGSLAHTGLKTGPKDDGNPDKQLEDLDAWAPSRHLIWHKLGAKAREPIDDLSYQLVLSASRGRDRFGSARLKVTEPATVNADSRELQDGAWVGRSKSTIVG